MRSFFRTLSVQQVLVLVVAIVGVSAQAPSGPAQPPSPFVGTWVLNVEKSTYEGSRPRKQSTRTLDAYGDGKIVATHRRTNGNGGQGFSYWAGNLFGQEFPEFARQRGNTPGNMVSIKEADAHVWNVSFRNQEGRIVLTDTWTVSADGQTLTIDRRGTSRGQPTHSVEVYENDGYAPPPRTSR